jgi:Flp pilus assembly protein TadB
MSNYVVVYKVSIEGSAEVLRILRKAKCHPVTSKLPDSTLHYTSHGTYLIKISVPREERNAAVKALKTWEKESLPGVKKHTNVFINQLIKSFLITVFIDILIILIFGYHGVILGFSILIWLVCLIVVANVGRISGVK